MVPEDMVPAEFQISCGGGGENAEPDLQYGRPKPSGDLYADPQLQR